MNSCYMLDTNIISHIIKDNFPSVQQKLIDTPMNQIVVSTITQAELLYGLAKKPAAKQLKTIVHEFLLRVDILPWDIEAANCYAEIRSELEKKGTPIGNMDMLIAAHALSADAILVSNDQAFRHIPHLQLVDWTRKPTDQ